MTNRNTGQELSPLAHIRWQNLANFGILALEFTTEENNDRIAPHQCAAHHRKVSLTRRISDRQAGQARSGPGCLVAGMAGLAVCPLRRCGARGFRVPVLEPGHSKSAMAGRHHRHDWGLASDGVDEAR
jgi:hypothetical protein